MAEIINLIDIARSGRFGPITLGGRLADFADVTGPPAYWGAFSDTKPLSCLMCFGGVEVGFFTDQDDLIVNYAQIDVSRFTRSHMKFARNLNGEELHIHNPFGKKYPKYDLVGKQMQQAGLEYTTDYGKWRVEPPLIMRFGLVTFYFHDEEQTLMEVVLAEHV